jgi:hypothetical protein
MAAVMVATMAFGHSVLNDLSGMLLLAATSLAYAPGARRDATFREHLVDLWAMALTLFACLPQHSGSGIHEHSGSPGGPLLVAAVLGGWLVARVALGRHPDERGVSGRDRWGRVGGGPGRARGGRIGRVARSPVVSLGVVGAGLVAMVVVCTFG